MGEAGDICHPVQLGKGSKRRKAPSWQFSPSLLSLSLPCGIGTACRQPRPKGDGLIARSRGEFLPCESVCYRISAANRRAVCPAQCIRMVRQPDAIGPAYSHPSGYRAARHCRCRGVHTLVVDALPVGCCTLLSRIARPNFWRRGVAVISKRFHCHATPDGSRGDTTIIAMTSLPSGAASCRTRDAASRTWVWSGNRRHATRISCRARLSLMAPPARFV
jgi:hypothetical protein